MIIRNESTWRWPSKRCWRPVARSTNANENTKKLKSKMFRFVFSFIKVNSLSSIHIISFISKNYLGFVPVIHWLLGGMTLQYFLTFPQLDFATLVISADLQKFFWPLTLIFGSFSTVLTLAHKWFKCPNWSYDMSLYKTIFLNSLKSSIL